MRRWKMVLMGFLILTVIGTALWRSEGKAGETVFKAFEEANFSDSSCHIYREGYLDDAYYMIREKEVFLENIGEALGRKRGRISREHLESGDSVVYEWMASDGKERVKLTFLTREEEGESREVYQENYLKAEIYLMKDVNTQKAIEERKLLEAATGECGLEEPVFFELEGRYEGKMEREDQKIVAEALFDEIGAARTDAVDEEALYTVYGYARGAGESQMVSGSPVNLNLAVTYDETCDETVFRLGCPMIGTDY